MRTKAERFHRQLGIGHPPTSEDAGNQGHGCSVKSSLIPFGPRPLGAARYGLRRARVRGNITAREFPLPEAVLPFMSVSDLLLLSAAALAAGVINSVAGGGTFLSFPALVFTGISPVVANATNTVALFPGQLTSAWAYRDHFPRIDGVPSAHLIGTSLAGGIAGAALLLLTPARAFAALVPWLLLFATLVFAFSRRVVAWLTARVHIGRGFLYALQFLLAIYGGYFGGAVGILMLALFGLFGVTDIHEANALKTLLSGLVNAIAVVCFVIAGKVAWFPASVMLVAAIAGGYLGARVAKRLPTSVVRTAVVVIGLTMSVVLFLRR